MAELVHEGISIPAAAVVASGQPLYPPGQRISAAENFAVHKSDTLTSDTQLAQIHANPGFGKYFTDHVARATWTAAGGWSNLEVIPSRETTAGGLGINALHYGQSIFEGLKAYRFPDGGVYAFRPEANALRFQRSAYRLALPPVPVELFIGALEQVVRIDQRWVPDGEDQSLYLRPLEFGAENALGIRPSPEVTFVTMASPVGAYFPQGVKPVRVWISEDFVRAAPGGTGEAKCAGNYAASLVAQAAAAQEGCDQVVWIDAIERKWIEEMGGMNLMFVYGSGAQTRIVTPRLTGTLLPGITRDSLLTLARDLGYQAEEGSISVDEWRDACADGRITETFACGTAAVITPVGSVASKIAGSWIIGDGQPGEVTMRLRKALVDIQTGKAQDKHNWMHRIV